MMDGERQVEVRIFSSCQIFMVSARQQRGFVSFSRLFFFSLTAELREPSRKQLTGFAGQLERKVAQEGQWPTSSEKKKPSRKYRAASQC